MPQVLLLHWNWSEVIDLAAELQHDGWDVVTESDDGVRAVRTALDHLPIAVAISLRVAPKHGRDVALALAEQSGGRGIPVVFFDGDERARKTVGKAVPDAMIVDWVDLPAALARLAALRSE
jgi:AmiR/NasT family two-component response regulator